MDKLTRNGYQRFLCWIRYDGSCFQEMALGNTNLSVMNLFNACAEKTFDIKENECFQSAPQSRTDKGVHAIRTPLIVSAPEKLTQCFASSGDKKIDLIRQFNELSRKVLNKNGLELLDMHIVSPGLSRLNVSYRKYVYRLCVPRNEDIWQKCRNNRPPLAALSEYYYSWIVHPGFDIYKAIQVCEFLGKTPHNFASFYKHKQYERKRGELYKEMIRFLFCVKIEPGDPYLISNEDFYYFDVTVVARSFVREQIRRIVGLLVGIATHQIDMKFLYFLVENPEPKNYFVKNWIQESAPPNGLFLSDVVYDPRMFLNPVPYDEILFEHEIENT